ncbi:CD209 antigen [Pimephales promelas]|nr:CD209 antigen [Pimephales promelas]
MDSEDIYQNVECRNIEDTFGPPTQSNGQDEGKDGKHRGSRCLVLMTVCLGLMCVLLLVFITLYITITAERDLLKNTVEEFTHTINRLQDKNTDLMTEKDQLKNNVSSLSQKKLELETRVMSLKEELKREVSKQGFFFISSESMSWPESRQYCTDRGADLVIINTEEKQRCITSLAKERVWIGLTDSDTEGIMKWVDKSPLKQGCCSEVPLHPPHHHQDGSRPFIRGKKEAPASILRQDLPINF